MGEPTFLSRRRGETPAPSAAARPRPAATVVLMRPTSHGPEVLLIQRPSTMAFAPDVHVFPGGAVDAGDRDPILARRSRVSAGEAVARMADDCSPEDALGAHLAAVRELFEEAGILLAEPASHLDGALAAARQALLAGSTTLGEVAESLSLELRTDLLVPLSRWVTPAFVPRRFDVRFFVAELPAGVEPTFVGDEVVGHRWLTPARALDSMARGDIELWIPTSVTLQQLEQVRSFDDVERRLAPARAEPMRTVREAPGIIRVAMPSAGGVSGQQVNAWIVGRREFVVVDPGDPSMEAIGEVERLVADGGRFVAIALTHSAPDHVAGAQALAEPAGVPVFAGRGAGRAVPIDVVELADGDRLPVGDVELTVVATPGPRPDHVAYAAPSIDAILAGDLIGPGPSRSILRPPDEAAWLASLARIEGLRRGLVLVGHGEPLSGAAAIDAAIGAARARLGGPRA